MMPLVTVGIPPAAVVYKIMNKHTIDNMDIGACYSVTCTSAATVTAEINGATATLLSLPAGGSGAFFAPADSVCVETEGEFRVLPTEAPAPVIGAAGGGSAPVEVDPAPMEGSANPVASGGVYDAIAAVSPREGDVARLASENTFTAAQAFHAPVTVGTPRVAAVWAKAAVTITDVNMCKAGTISDNDGHTLDMPEDSTRTQDGFAKAIGDSELGLTVTHIGTTYTLYDSSSPAGQEGTIGNTRKVYLEGFGYSSRQTLSLSGGKDGVAEVGQPVMLNGNVYIGHGPEGVKARCRFDIRDAYLVRAGTITDNNPNHPFAIELPEDPARTIDSCIAEINEQGYKLEVKAIKYNATNIYLEATEAGAAPNGVWFTRTGCFSTAAAGTAQSFKQGSDIQGLDEGAASDWELRQNGYPVASRQTNNVYEGVQVFNNAVALNGNISGASLLGYPANKAGALIDAEGVCRTVFNEFFDATGTYGSLGEALTNIATLMPGYKDRGYLDILLPNAKHFAFRQQSSQKWKRIRIYAPSMIYCSAASGYAFSEIYGCPELEEFIVWAPAYISTCNRMFTNWFNDPKLMYIAVYLDSVKDATGFAFSGNSGKHITIYVPKATKAAEFSEVAHTALKTLKLTTGPATNCENMLRYWGGLEDLIWNGVGQDGTRMANPVQFVTAGTGVFSGCAALPASKFPKSWPSLSSARDIFLNCSLLDAATANAILDSLPDWSTEETPADHTITFTGTAAATAWAEEGADLSHVEAAEAKGWTVER